MASSGTRSVRERASELIIEVGFRLIQVLEKLIARYSLVGNSPLLPPERFSWIPAFEAEWKTIRSELDQVMTYRDDLPNFQDIQSDQATLTDDDRWKTFFFYGYGFKSDRNCARCPATTAALERIPGMTTAFFSILSPHKHIDEHRVLLHAVPRHDQRHALAGDRDLVHGECRLQPGRRAEMDLAQSVVHPHAHSSTTLRVHGEPHERVVGTADAGLAGGRAHERPGREERDLPTVLEHSGILGVRGRALRRGPG